MFDIGWPELFLIAVVVLLVIGPKELPRVLRTVGVWVGKAKAVTREFRGHMDDMMRETELDDVKRQFDEASNMDMNSMIENTIDPDHDMKDAVNFDDSELVDSFETDSDLDVYGVDDDGTAITDFETLDDDPDLVTEPEPEDAPAATADEPEKAGT